MPATDPADGLAARTTRRRVLAAGSKLAYAAPLVAVSMKMSAGHAAAQISPGSGCPEGYALVNGDCFLQAPCVPNISGISTEGLTLCQTEVPDCGTPCTTSEECPEGNFCLIAPGLCGGNVCAPGITDT
jgi:hypothetical protein